VKVSPFIEAIKAGKRIKVGTQWVSSHRQLPVSDAVLPAVFVERLTSILKLLAVQERNRPSTPGASQPIALGGKSGEGLTYKWIGKADDGHRQLISGVKIDAARYLSVEIGKEVAAFFHENDQVLFRVAVPSDLAELYQEILSRTPAKFIGKESLAPCTGVADKKHLEAGRSIIGLDESGRGTIAGPLIAAAFFIEAGTELPEVFDSKGLGVKQRFELAAQLRKAGFVYEVVSISAEEVDAIGINEANAKAFRLAVQGCITKAGKRPDVILADGGKVNLETTIPVECITKGELVSRAIAAASVLATSTHDQIMQAYDQEYPQWGFGEHRGYVTKPHVASLTLHGIAPIHRKSFNPIRDMLAAQARQVEAKDQLKLI
jgi:ribonuclease HII